MNPKSITANSTKSISIEITTCCPLKCVYCERKIQNKTLTYEEFVKLKELIDAQKSIERINLLWNWRSLFAPRYLQND